MAPQRNERILQVVPWVFSIIVLFMIRHRHITAYPSIDPADPSLDGQPAAAPAAAPPLPVAEPATTLPPLPSVPLPLQPPYQLPPLQRVATAASAVATAARATTPLSVEDATRAVDAVIARVANRDQLVTKSDARLLGITLGKEDLNKALRLTKKKVDKGRPLPPHSSSNRNESQYLT